MNATVFFSAVKSAQKFAAIGFFAILGLGLASSIAVAFSALLALLTPLLIAGTKAAVYGYPFFITGLIAFKMREQHQKKNTGTIAVLPPCKPHAKYIKQIEITQNKVLTTPLSAETIFNCQPTPKQPTWQQQILNEIRLGLSKENQDASEPTEAITKPGLDTASHHDAKPLNNQLAIFTICWQAIGETGKLLDGIKASEMKSIASKIEIPKYRSMNKTQLLLSISEHDLSEIAV